jgi:hypothetical protein
MDALSIWPGNDYAYFHRRRRGEEYRENGKRIKVIRLEKRVEYGNSRESTYVICRFLNDDGTPATEEKYDYETRHYTTVERGIEEVKARDLHSLWSHYVDERNDRNSKKDREIAERNARLEAENAAARKRVETVARVLGVEPSDITIRWNMVEVRLDAVERLIEAVANDEPDVTVTTDSNGNDDDDEVVEGHDETDYDTSDYMRSIIEGKY